MEETIYSFGSNLLNGGLFFFVIRSLVIGVIAIILAKVTWKAFGRFANKTESQEMSLRFIGRVIRFVIYIIAIFSILGGIKPLAGLGSAMLGATSVISVVLGLAAQESFGNFIAGFFLAMYHPFNVGDVIYLKEKDIAGTVIGITFRHTEIKTNENAKIIIPNSIMNSAIVENRMFGQDEYTRYISFDIGYDSDMEVVEKLIYEAVLSCKDVVDKRSEKQKKNHEKPFIVRVDDFEASGIKITFPLCTNSFSTSFVTASEVRKKLLRSFQENGIEIPYQKIEILKTV